MADEISNLKDLIFQIDLLINEKLDSLDEDIKLLSFYHKALQEKSTDVPSLELGKMINKNISIIEDRQLNEKGKVNCTIAHMKSKFDDLQKAKEQLKAFIENK
jgi:hypothetical protein